MIRSVRHRYVAEFQKTLSRFAVRYAGQPGLVALPVREGFQEQVRSLVLRRHDSIRKLFEFYRQHPVPIGTLADRCERTAFETLLALAHEPEVRIVSRFSTRDLEDKAIKILNEAEAMVLDPTAVAALALLNLLDMPG